MAYARPEYGLPEARLKNCYLEASPAGPTEAARLPRPGLSSYLDLGTGPIRLQAQADGAFSGDVFRVSGAGLYRGSSAIYSPLATTGSARAALSGKQLALVCGGTLYVYDGTTVTPVSYYVDGVNYAPQTDQPLPAYDDVVYLSGRFYFLRSGSDIWDFSEIADATKIQGLSFESAEAKPDPDIGAAVLASQVFFFGTQSVEPFYQTGNTDAPLQAAQGYEYTRGCISQASIIIADNAIFWVGDDRKVYRTSNVPQRVSDYGVEERLRACTDPANISGLRVTIDGHELIIVNIPGQTSFAYDISTSQWAEWGSYGRATFRCQNAIVLGGICYLGDDTTGQVWMLDVNASDDNGDPIEKVISGGLLCKGGAIPNFNVMLQCVRGVGLADQSDPTVDMRYSDDGGRTWSNWLSASLGKQGQYDVKAIWRRLGLIKSPGRAFEWRSTDSVRFVASGATYNVVQP